MLSGQNTKPKMIKLVYVMTGVEKPEYLNMLRISVASAKMRSPDVPVEIVTDNATGEYLLSNRVFDSENVSVVCADTPENYSIVEKSRYLKTNLRQIVRGDFLFIDSDTIVCADLSGVCPEASVSLVLDEHVPLSEQEDGGAMIRAKAARVGISLDGCTRYFNSGVILSKDDDTARQFFRRWYEKWENTRKPGMHQDQFSLNAVNAEMDVIEELDGTWNCQLTAGDAAFANLRNVKILHYLSIQPHGIYRLNDISLMRRALTDEEIGMIAAYPEKQFKPFHFYADDSPEYQVLNGAQYRLAYRWYTSRPKLYNTIEKLLSKLRK